MKRVRLSILNSHKPNEVNWQSGSQSGTDWYEAIEVAPNTYYIDMTFADTPRECRTFFVNTETRRVLSVHTVMREGDVGKEPRAVQDFQPGVLGDPNIPPTGMKPAPTRDLIGLRALYTYNSNQCFEHIYLNGERYAWHCVVGPLKGESDVELHITYKFDVNQYIFSWREFGLPVSTVFFHNWDQMKETGKFFRHRGRWRHRQYPRGRFDPETLRDVLSGGEAAALTVWKIEEARMAR